MTLSLIATLTWFLRTTITVAKNYTNSNQKKAKRCKKMMMRVGFEPTQISLLAPEASALDRSAISPDDVVDERDAFTI
jgi:hypothetical protein